MKKFLLFALAAMSSSALFAQVDVTGINDDFTALVMEESAPQSTVEGLEAVVGEPAPEVQKRSKSSGLYYTKPTGIMYDNRFPASGGWYYASTYVAPAFKDFTYVNKSTNPSNTHFGYTSSITGGTYNDLGGGDYTQSLTPGYMTYALWLFDTNDANHYNMAYADNNGYALTYNHPVYMAGHIDTTDNMYAPQVDTYYTWMGYADNKTYYSGSSSTESGYWAGSQRDYTSTTWTVTDANGTRQTVSGTFYNEYVQQSYPAPPSPMYVTGVKVYMGVKYDSGTAEEARPFATDDYEFPMTITTESGKVYELTTSNAQYDYLASGNASWNLGTFARGFLTFTVKEEDPLFGLMDTPFVLDEAFTVKIGGDFTDSNVNLGLFPTDIQDCDEDTGIGTCQLYWKDTSGTYPTVNTYIYWSAYALCLYFDGLMDNVYAYETLYWTNSSTGVQTQVDGYNKLIISADGKTCYNRDMSSSYNIGGAYIRTTLEFTDPDTGVENYDITPTIDEIGWLSNMYYEPESSTNTYVISFDAQENTSNESREAVVYFTGKGCTDTLPIYITQLGANGADGIESVEVEPEVKNGAVYNLAGQQVSETAKGIVIKEGKKVLNK